MTQTMIPQPRIQLAFVLSDWVPDAPYVVRHTEFGLYMSFASFEDAFTYARSVALMMDLEMEIVA